MITINFNQAKKCNGDYSMFITFPYNEKIVSTIKNFPSRYYEPTSKEWEVPASKLEDLLLNLEEFDFDITYPKEMLISKDNQVIEFEDFTFKTKPYSHQIEAFNYGLNHNKWLLGDEMGLGKSKEAIDIAVAKKELYGYQHCFIICGVNSLKWNWVNEVETHSNETAWVLGQRERNGKLYIGTTQDKIDDLKNIKLISSYFIITNIETLRQDEIIKELNKLEKSKTIQMIVFDECHKAKNPSSQQGKGMLKLNAETMIAMTGTPLMNTPLDTYIILKWLGYEKHSFYQFKNHYCVMGGFGGHQIVGYRYLDELQEELDKIMLRRRKEEVLDLPEKTYINEYVEMTPKQEQIYREVTADIQANIDQVKKAVNPLSALIRMRQATGYTGILSSTIKESAKLDRMEELVEEAVTNGKKVVIFSNWTQMTDVISERLAGNFNIGIVTGETKDIERQNIVNKFQNGDLDVVIGTIGAMGTGLTLTAGTVEIFMDEPWNMALKEQAVDRCYRIGQKNNITIYTLMCKDTIDERINDLIVKKGIMADAIVDKKSDMSIDELLQYLIS